MRKKFQKKNMVISKRKQKSLPYAKEEEKRVKKLKHEKKIYLSGINDSISGPGSDKVKLPAILT